MRSKDKSRPSLPANNPVIDMLGRDYLSLSRNDDSIKFWIPERLEKKIDQLCTYFDISASDFIRQVLFVHLYGRYDLVGLIERQGQNVKEEHIIRFSLTINDTPKDKNIADVKVWLPSTMKGDLKKLAAKHSMKLSKYVRRVLTSHILGNLPVDTTLSAQEPPLGLQEE